jgi:hypothetical protein
MKRENLESARSDRGTVDKKSVPHGLKPSSSESNSGTAERRALPRLVPSKAVTVQGCREDSSRLAAGFTPRELRKLRSLKNPYGIQRFLDDASYHLEDTAWSPRRVLAEGSAHCLEGAIFAAAALRANGYPPLLLDFEAEHDTDHVIAIYKEDGCWGAVAKSNYAGCRWREPVYKSLRELALSYFNAYFNLRRERTLRRFSGPVNLKRFDDQNWMTTDKEVWFVVDHLFEIKHYPLITAAQAKRLHRVDERLFQAECLGKAMKSGE